MTTSDNGWPVIRTPVFPPHHFPRLRRFVIPGSREIIILRDGSAGFLLCHLAAWYNDRIQKIDGKILDDWGWNYREISGTAVYSNHASGTAIDLNATTYPQGTQHMTTEHTRMIHKRLVKYRGVIRWGGDYQHARKDQMHFEINSSLSEAEKLAKKLMVSPRGQHLLKANPGLREAILS